MSYQLGWAAKWEEAVGVATRGLATLGDLPNPDRARLLAAAWVSGLAGDYAGATGMFAAARDLATQLGDETTRPPNATSPPPASPAAKGRAEQASGPAVIGRYVPYFDLDPLCHLSHPDGVRAVREVRIHQSLRGGQMSALNVAATWVGTRALGPGRRSVVWVQGCPFRCAGCISPEWIPQRPARVVEPATLAAELLADPAVTGLTFSGGEPMAQAAGLAAVARCARRVRDLSLICFTGYRLERLQERPPTPGVVDHQPEVDVLIDGRYVAARNDGRGLRGSSNQRVHHLTDRLTASGYDFAGRPREVEIGVTDREVFLIGVPAPDLLAVFDTAVDLALERSSP
jgi:anaerobic ribonucleoside-triphosphate reductase activating protein